MRTKIASSSVLAGALTLMSMMTAPALAQAQIKEASRARETIQVGLIDRTFFPQPVFVAIQNGYFADEGLNANIRFIRSGEGQAAGPDQGRPACRAVVGRRHHP